MNILTWHVASQVLYLGAASGTSVSHVSDIVGPTGTVYAVEFSHRSGKLAEERWYRGVIITAGFASFVCTMPI